MDLALGGTRADSAPADEAGDVLRRNHVEEFGSGGHAHLGQVKEQVPRLAQAVVDFVRLIEIRVVDEARPPDGGARLFEVHAHDDAQVGGKLGNGIVQQRAVLARGGGVVDRAWPHQNQQSGIAPAQDFVDLVAGSEYGFRGGLGDGKLFLEEYRRKNHLGPLNMNIFSCAKHGSFLARCGPLGEIVLAVQLRTPLYKIYQPAVRWG